MDRNSLRQQSYRLQHYTVGSNLAVEYLALNQGVQGQHLGPHPNPLWD